ncbi:glutathione S-transferase N-terminal domain-containing protein [Sphingomonas profundi]|uniref:glutathione S-transferase N-terminal domain-containing protein n=1 Tax=Alterirhizorhabdus profundi TaxID=2681549 RepID=UPI0012E72EF8|nr:glutathione S-transferase N-terminal domain-containing protein [Sphingomonas profundi]
MAYTLINARPSPFGRKVAIVLHEKHIVFDVHYDVPWGDRTCTPEYSPLEQLPILVTDEKEVVYDSSYIVEWLEARFPEPALLPSALPARLAALKRQMLGERLMEVAQSLIFELHRPDPSAAWVDRQTRKVRGALAELERLYGLRARAADNGLDLGDIAVATTLLGIEFAVESGLSPNVTALLWRRSHAALGEAVSALEARPSFAETRPQMMDVNLQATVA